MHHVTVRARAERQIEAALEADEVSEGVVFAVVEDAPDIAGLNTPRWSTV